MKISIPEKLKSDVDILEAVFLETATADAEGNISAFVGSSISLQHIAAVGFIDLHNNVFENCTKIQYRIVYKNKTTEIFKFNHKTNAIYKSKMTAAAQLCVRHKVSDSYEDTDEGRLKCLAEIDLKITEAATQPIDGRGTKNLVYYTIYFNKGYVEILNKSVESILKHSSANFDLLLITDEVTKELILKQPFVKKITPKFHITETPFDGVEASQNKTRVFEYESIEEYDKVLFLDCDVICLKDVNAVLNQSINHDTFYTARNTNLNFWHHKTFHHGFELLGDPHVNEMRMAKQMPFNAGQFLFRVSKRMKAHFDNVKWFMRNWSGEYFFEQAFICYYFCKAYITDDSVLNPRMSIISTTNKIEYEITKDTCLVHFIAPPLDAATKLAFIENFESELVPQAAPSLISKLKQIFSFKQKIK